MDLLIIDDDSNFVESIVDAWEFFSWKHRVRWVVARESYCNEKSGLMTLDARIVESISQIRERTILVVDGGMTESVLEFTKTGRISRSVREKAYVLILSGEDAAYFQDQVREFWERGYLGCQAATKPLPIFQDSNLVSLEGLAESFSKEE